MSGYLVSSRYDNPDEIDGVDVLRIEDCQDAELKNVIIAVSGQAIWSIADDLKQYNIDRLFILSPFIIDDFPLEDILSSGCDISEKAIISPKAQIFADETSQIIIRDHVIINDSVRIFAIDHSKIEISDELSIGKGSFINAEDGEILLNRKIIIGKEVDFNVRNSRLAIREKTGIGSKTEISANDSSDIIIGDNVALGTQTLIMAGNNSSVKIGNYVSIGNRCIINIGSKGTVRIGNCTTIEVSLFLGVAASVALIGEDCMLSSWIKMNTGAHTLYDCFTGTNITHREGINVGNHVWVGINATILDGCNIGDGSVIGASSVVTKDIPPHTTCAGNPAKVLRNNVMWKRKTE